MPHLRAVFPDCPPDVRKFLTAEHRGLVPELDVPDDPGTAELRSAALAGYDAAVVYVLKITDDVLARNPQLRAIAYLSTGAASHVDMVSANRRGVSIRNVPGYSTRAVAEHTIGLMLAASRNIVAMDRRIRAGQWRQLGGQELSGKTLGIIGLGEIGREVARLAAAFGMRVLAANRTPRAGPWTLLPIDEVLSRSDIVSLHIAHTADTELLLDRRRLGLLKASAILVNVGRGKLIDEPALVESLAERRIAHAALDVFAMEPLGASHPLAQLDNTTLTAHSAWYTSQATTRLLDGGLTALREELDRLAKSDIARSKRDGGSHQC